MPLGNGFPLSGSGGILTSKSPADAGSPTRALVPSLQLGFNVIHDSSGMLEPLYVPLKGLDVPLGVNVVIRV